MVKKERPGQAASKQPETAVAPIREGPGTAAGGTSPRPLLSSWLGLVNDLRQSWKDAWDFFDYRKTDTTVDGAIARADFRNGVVLFLLGTLFASLVAFILISLSTYFAAYSYPSISEKGVVAEPDIDMSSIYPVAAFLFLFGLPFSFLLGLVQEGAIAFILKLTGGKGTFRTQYYLGAVVGLSIAIAGMIGFLIPFPLLGLVAVLAEVLVTIYLMFYIRAKAYARIHDVSYLHSLVINILVLLPTTVAGFFIGNAVMGYFQILAPGAV